MKTRVNDTKKNNIPPLVWLWNVVGRQKISIMILSLFQTILGIGSVMFAFLFRDLIDLATAGERALFFRTILFLIALEIGQIVVGLFIRFMAEWTRASLENCFKSRLFSCLLQKDYASVTALHSGEWLTRLTSDTVITANGIVEIIPGMAGILTRLIGALIALFFLEPSFFYLFLPFGFCVLLIITGLRKVLKRLHKQIQEANAAVLSFLQERLDSLMMIKVFSVEKQTCEAANLKMEQHKSARIKRNRFSSICNSGFGAAIDGGYLFGAVYCGYGILKGTISYGTFMAVLRLIGQVQSRFSSVSGIIPLYYSILASTERLMEVETYEDDGREGQMISWEICNFYQKNFKAIGVRNACFSYSEENENSEKEYIINQLNFEIKKGEYVALIGHSGCGKSTLLKLFMCLYPLDSGERYLKAQEDSNIYTEYELTSAWRRLFAYVPQGNQLMSGTIREIITFGQSEDMTQDSRLRQALKIACADEFVQSLEKGMDTQLGEHGSGLSEGQMQRIAIARAIFSDRPILILDESTSSLDGETEKKLLQNLRQMTDKTVLIITHRPAALEICDRKIDMTKNSIK